MVLLKGWKFGAMVGSIFAVITITIYPIIIAPMIDPEPYKQLQSRTRKGIKQEEIQPGNMKVWTDPFDRTKEV